MLFLVRKILFLALSFKTKIGVVGTVCLEFKNLTQVCAVHFRPWKLEWNNWNTYINIHKFSVDSGSINLLILGANKDFAFFSSLVLKCCNAKLLCCFWNVVKDKNVDENVDRNVTEAKKSVYLKFKTDRNRPLSETWWKQKTTQICNQKHDGVTLCCFRSGKTTEIGHTAP